eukprot:432359_1
MYASFKEYANTYNTSFDKWIITQLIPKLELFKQESNRRCLLIGPGPTPSIDLITDYFDEFILVEPNTLYIENWKSLTWWNKCKKLGKNIIAISTAVENLWLLPNEYSNMIQFNSINFILSNHSAYYFPVKHMKNLLSFLISLLKCKQYSLLSIGVGDDTLNLTSTITKEINPKYTCSVAIESSLKSLKNIKYSTLTNYLNDEFDTLDKAIDVLRFYAKEMGWNKNWNPNGLRLNQKEEKVLEEILSRVKTNIKQKNGKFLLPSHNIHYLVERNCKIKSLL